MVAALRGRGIIVAMVTGDDPGAAAGVAESLGIAEVAAGVLPGGKAEAVRRFRQAHGPVAFVGDGVNDAPPSPRRMSASPSGRARTSRSRAPTWC